MAKVNLQIFKYNELNEIINKVFLKQIINCLKRLNNLIQYKKKNIKNFIKQKLILQATIKIIIN